MAPIDFTTLIHGLKRVLGEEVLDLLAQETKDAVGPDGFLSELSSLLASAVVSNSAQLLNEVKANLPWIAERHRIRISKAAESTLRRLVGVAVGAANVVLNSLTPEPIKAEKNS